jgi:hypothetical protein
MVANDLEAISWWAIFRRKIVIIAGLLLFFILALQAATSKSPTADEGMHMLRGLTLWQNGSLELQGQHTPLSHWLIGSLFFTEPSLPIVEQLPSWTAKSPEHLMQEFLWQGSVNVSRLLLLGRIPIILLGLCFGAVLGRWADRNFGFLALVTTMVLFAFSPNILASSALATTDLVAAVTFTLAILMVWSYWQKPTIVRWLLVGIFLGLGLGAKLTGILLLPILLVLSYANKGKQPWWRPGLIWLSWLPLAALVLWEIYGLEIGQVAGWSLPVPAATYASNFIEVQQHIDRGHFAYLFGEISNQGWWYYFPATLLVKTPVVTLVLTVLAVIYVVRSRSWRKTIYLWFPALLFLAAASYSRLNIGYRHILPVLPLIWLLIGSMVQEWYPQPNKRRLLYAALVLYAVLLLRQVPHYLSYFNELVGGSEQGYNYLGDSNIDWGQDLESLADYVNNLDEKPYFISYFGPSDPAYYGLANKSLIGKDGLNSNLAPANPAPGRYLISVNHWQGTTEIEPDSFAWFRDKQPSDHVGYSILVFDVEEKLPGSWIGHCIDPEPLIDEEQALWLVGQDVDRQLYFDCRSSWVLPSAGRQPGWFILPADAEPSVISSLFPDQLMSVYENHNSPATQPYSVYYWPGTDDAEDRLRLVNTSPEGFDAIVNIPFRVGDLARSLGGTRLGSTWTSIWQSEQETDRPLSIKMHLFDDQDQIMVGDGLGFSPIQWHKDDIFMQFLEDPNFSGNRLETGIYNYISGDELPLKIAGKEASSIHIEAP